MMTGLLVLHIAALLCWLASLLYLPVLIASSEHRPALAGPPDKLDSVARLVFIQIAGPAAIVAIVAGTLLFVVTGTTAPWLVAKLGLVSLLVVGHALTGLLILRLEAPGEKLARPWCVLLLTVFCVLATAILWLVLRKPSWALGGWIH